MEHPKIIVKNAEIRYHHLLQQAADYRRLQQIKNNNPGFLAGTLSGLGQMLIAVGEKVNALGEQVNARGTAVDWQLEARE